MRRNKTESTGLLSLLEDFLSFIEDILYSAPIYQRRKVSLFTFGLWMTQKTQEYLTNLQKNDLQIPVNIQIKVIGYYKSKSLPTRATRGCDFDSVGYKFKCIPQIW